MVELFGNDILKIILLIFIAFNIKYFFTFQYLGKYNKLITLFLSASLLSIFINWEYYPDIQIPFIALIAVISYFVVFSQLKEVKHVLLAIVVALIISSIYSFIRVDTISEYTFRKTGGTGDPNEFSTMLLIGIGLLSGYYLDFKRHFLIVLILVLLFITSLIFAGSKSALIVLIILIIYIMRSVYIQSKDIKKIRNVFFTIVLILGAYFAIETYFSEVLNLLIARFENQGSGEERIKSWLAGLNLLETNFFFGVGPTNYANVIGNNFHASIVEGSREAHNMFVKALVESGFFGFIPFILIVYNRLKIIVFNKKEHIFTLMFISVLLMGLSLSLTYEKYTWLIFALLFNPSIYSMFKGKNKL